MIRGRWVGQANVARKLHDRARVPTAARQSRRMRFEEPSRDLHGRDVTLRGRRVKELVSGFPRPARLRFTPIENFNKLARAALQRLREPQDHGETRHLHAAFEIADERVIGPAPLRKFALRQIARRSELAQALAEDDAFACDFWCQSRPLLLTTGCRERILWDT
jgi:hypothetical protein